MNANGKSLFVRLALPLLAAAASSPDPRKPAWN